MKESVKLKAMIFECTVRIGSGMFRSLICSEGVVKELKKRSRWPAAGEKILGFGPLSGLIQYPPGGGGVGPRI